MSSPPSNSPAAGGGARAGAAAPDPHGEDGHAGHGSAEHLVQMANDIGNFFRSEPEHKDAVAGIANHIAKFWTPRMRQKLLAHLKEHGDAHLDELPREALQSLARAAAPKIPEPPGGDAG
ncbi:MAG TPA: formate dehydrogenase subunit delta [Steroidobacteraceae bacterium]|nr:formate dehydrogenase subunit delta [Steroidobacteraceae bacterium]